MLGEVADNETSTFMANTADRLELAGEDFYESGLARAIRSQQTETCSGPQRELDIAQNGATGITGRHAVERDKRIRRSSRLCKMKIERRIDMRGCDVLHAVERFEAALRLTRFGRFGAKAFDEALEV